MVFTDLSSAADFLGFSNSRFAIICCISACSFWTGSYLLGSPLSRRDEFFVYQKAAGCPWDRMSDHVFDDDLELSFASEL